MVSGQFPGSCVTGTSDHYLGLGPICRYSEDLEPMLRCMTYEDCPIDFKKPLNFDVGIVLYLSRVLALVVIY